MKIINNDGVPTPPDVLSYAVALYKQLSSTETKPLTKAANRIIGTRTPDGLSWENISKVYTVIIKIYPESINDQIVIYTGSRYFTSTTDEAEASVGGGFSRESFKYVSGDETDENGNHLRAGGIAGGRTSTHYDMVHVSRGGAVAAGPSRISVRIRSIGGGIASGTSKILLRMRSIGGGVAGGFHAFKLFAFSRGGGVASGSTFKSHFEKKIGGAIAGGLQVKSTWRLRSIGGGVAAGYHVFGADVKFKLKQVHGLPEGQLPYGHPLSDALEISIFPPIAGTWECVYNTSTDLTKIVLGIQGSPIPPSATPKIITATFRPSDVNYPPITAGQEILVVKHNVNIVVDPAQATYLAAAQQKPTTTVTLNPEGTALNKALVIVGEPVFAFQGAPIGVASYPYTAKMPDSSYYQGSASGVFVIKQAPVSYNVLPVTTHIYDSLEKDIVVTSTIPAGVSFNRTFVPAPSAGKNKPTQAGTYSVILSSADPNYVGGLTVQMVIQKYQQILSDMVISAPFKRTYPRVTDAYTTQIDYPNYFGKVNDTAIVSVTGDELSSAATVYTSSNPLAVYVSGDRLFSYSKGSTFIRSFNPGDSNCLESIPNVMHTPLLRNYTTSEALVQADVGVFQEITNLFATFSIPAPTGAYYSSMVFATCTPTAGGGPVEYYTTNPYAFKITNISTGEGEIIGWGQFRVAAMQLGGTFDGVVYLESDIVESPLYDALPLPLTVVFTDTSFEYNEYQNFPYFDLSHNGVLHNEAIVITSSSQVYAGSYFATVTVSDPRFTGYGSTPWEITKRVLTASVNPNSYIVGWGGNRYAIGSTIPTPAWTVNLSNIGGVWSYDNTAENVYQTIGSGVINGTFTPHDSANNTSPSTKLTIYVTKAIPPVSWPEKQSVLGPVSAGSSGAFNATCSIEGRVYGSYDSQDGFSTGFQYMEVNGTWPMYSGKTLELGTKQYYLWFFPKDTAHFVDYINFYSTITVTQKPKKYQYLTVTTTKNITTFLVGQTTYFYVTGNVTKLVSMTTGSANVMSVDPSRGQGTAQGIGAVYISYTAEETADYYAATGSVYISVVAGNFNMDWNYWIANWSDTWRQFRNFTYTCSAGNAGGLEQLCPNTSIIVYSLNNKTVGRYAAQGGVNCGYLEWNGVFYNIHCYQEYAFENMEEVYASFAWTPDLALDTSLTHLMAVPGVSGQTREIRMGSWLEANSANIIGTVNSALRYQLVTLWRDLT